MIYRKGVVLLVMSAGYFLVLLDVTVINVALPSIRGSLGAEVGTLQWVVDGYAVALAALLLTGGSLGDLHGHRRVVTWGFALFGAASLVCGLAPNTLALVSGRVAQGVGAAMLLPGTLAIITQTYRGDRPAQARAISLWAAVGSLALPAGPLVGGLLIEATGWRGVFLVNVPLVALAMVAGARIVREEVESGEPSESGLDWPGAVLAAAFLGALTLAFIEAGRAGWTSVPVIVATISAAITLYGFVLVERRSYAPMLPLDLFRVPGFVGANVAAGLMNLVTLGTIFILTLYLQTVRGDSALLAGIEAIPMFAPLSILAPLGGRLAARFGARVPMVGGLALGVGGMLFLSRLEANSSYLTGVLPPMVLIGACLGFLTPAVVAAAMASVPDSRSGLASGVNNTARQACGAIGVALFGSLAGSPDSVESFMEGLRAAAFAGAGLWVCGAVISLLLVSGRDE